MLIGDALARYATQLAANGRSCHTLAQVRRHILLLDRWLASNGRSTEVESLDHEDLACFLASDAVRLRADGQARKPSSANALRSSVRAFFGFLFDADIVKRDPARLVRRARIGHSDPRGLTGAEEHRLRDALEQASTSAEHRDRVLLLLMLDAGLRVGSATAIRVQDFDPESRELRIVTLKGGGERTVELREDVARVLGEYIGDRRQGWAFEGQGGAPITPRHVRRRMQSWLERAGIRRAHSPHSLRHSFAKRLYAETRDLLLVRDALSHASIVSTVRYAATQHTSKPSRIR